MHAPNYKIRLQMFVPGQNLAENFCPRKILGWDNICHDRPMVAVQSRVLMDYGRSSPLAVTTVDCDCKLPRGVHTVKVSGQHMYQSMPKLTSSLVAATQMTTILYY